MENRIIIAEDDAMMAGVLSECLSSNGYIIETAKDGNEALKKYQANPAQVVITDIEMPNMDGNELINHLNSFELPPVIFVTTSHQDSSLIIDIMKKGVYDYFIKPVDCHALLFKVTRAFDTFAMKRSLEIAQKEKIIRLESSLEWYKFEEKLTTRATNEMGTNIFESLLTSINQGAGFGSLISLMKIIAQTAVPDNMEYRIDKRLFDAIMSNVNLAEKALNIFSDISKITSEPITTEKVSISQLHDYINAQITRLNNLIQIRKHKIIICDKKDFFNTVYTDINLNHYMRAFEEVLINALKFSPASSDIIILFQKQGNNFIISVINDSITSDTDKRGIPMEYENLVFEPFYRLTKIIYEDYQTLDYGLGLTLAKKIINKHGGQISLNNITDHSDLKSGTKIRIECSISLAVYS